MANAGVVLPAGGYAGYGYAGAAGYGYAGAAGYAGAVGYAAGPVVAAAPAVAYGGVYAGSYDPSVAYANLYPAAEPYVDVQIPAEPYIHQEPVAVVAAPAVAAYHAAPIVAAYNYAAAPAVVHAAINYAAAPALAYANRRQGPRRPVFNAANFSSSRTWPPSLTPIPLNRTSDSSSNSSSLPPDSISSLLPSNTTVCPSTVVCPSTTLCPSATTAVAPQPQQEGGKARSSLCSLNSCPSAKICSPTAAGVYLSTATVFPCPPTAGGPVFAESAATGLSASATAVYSASASAATVCAAASAACATATV